MSIKLKAKVLVEKGAGLSSFVSDEQYETAGAKVISRAEIFEQSDIILQINAPTDEDLNSLKQGKNLKDMSLEEMDKLWDEAKLQEKKDDK